MDSVFIGILGFLLLVFLGPFVQSLFIIFSCLSETRFLRYFRYKGEKIITHVTEI